MRAAQTAQQSADWRWKRETKPQAVFHDAKATQRRIKVSVSASKLRQLPQPRSAGLFYVQVRDAR